MSEAERIAPVMQELAVEKAVAPNGTEKADALYDVEKVDVTQVPTATSQHSRGMHDLPPISAKKAAPLVLTLMGAAFLNTMSVQTLVIALPSIGQDLDIPQGRYQWMLSAYNLSFGCFLLLWGKLGDLYGKRLMFLIGGVWVAGTTLGTAFTRDEIVFDLLRGLQGLGAAANVPAAIGILGTTIPPGKIKNYAFAAYSAGAPLGSVMGNILGGALTQYANWHWIFYLIAIMSSVITFIALFVIPPPPVNPTTTAKKLTLDWFGALLITAGLCLLIFSLSEGSTLTDGWRQSPMVPALFAVSIVLIVAFLYWEHYMETKTQLEPLMRISLFKNKKFSIALFITAFFWAAFSNFLVYATYFYQEYLQMDPIQTTLRFIPTGVVGVLTTMVSGRVLGRVSGHKILAFGITSTSISCLLFAVPIPPSTSYFAYALFAMSFSVFGADTVYPCLALFTTSALPLKDQALAGGLFNTVAQVGRAIGLAVATAIDEAVRDGGGNKLGSYAVKGTQTYAQVALLSGIRSSQWFSFVLAVLALGATLIGLRDMGKVGAGAAVGRRR